MENEAIRSKKLIKNASWATAGYMVYAIAGFVSRSIFVNQLGDVITGVATLFTSVMSLLSMAELGFSGAISIHLYKPVAEGDKEQICALLNLYRRAYKIVALFVLGLGLCLTPLIHLFVKTDQVVPQLRWYFLLYVIKSVVSYCYAYKSVLMTVNQESYRSSVISNTVLVAVTVLQAAALHFTANYTLYLIIGILGTLVTNIWVSAKVDRLYPFVKAYQDATVSEEEKKSIFSFIKATAIDRISETLKTTTDNLIVSGVVNVAITGIVGNYNMILTTVNTFLTFFFHNLAPAVGNMVATTDKESQYRTFRDLEYITFWVYGFLATGMLCTMTPFVRDVWLRNLDMLLPQRTLMLIVFSFFLSGTTWPASTFFAVKGLIRKMPFLNMFNVLANLALSLLLVAFFDVDGVYMGTIISFAVTYLPIVYYYVLRYHFDGRFAPCIKIYCYYFLVCIIGAATCCVLCGLITRTGILGVLCRIVICTLVFNGIYLLASFRSKEFHSIFTLVKGLVKR